MNRRLSAGACVALAACAPAATPPVTPPPVPGAAATVPVARPPAPTGPLVVRYGPQSLRYVVRRQIENVQTFAGAEQRSALGFTLFIVATVHSATDSSGYPTVFSIDSVTVDSGVVLPSFINLDLARRLSYSGVLTPEGVFQGGTASDTVIARNLAPIIGGFREFYPRIPRAGFTLGAAWVDTVSHDDQLGVIEHVTVTSIDSMRAVSWEEAVDSGPRSMRLLVHSTVTLTGSGQQGGQEVVLTGSGTRTGMEFIAADGRYLGGVSRDSTSLLITLRAQGQVVPVRQVVVSTVRAVP